MLDNSNVFIEGKKFSAKNKGVQRAEGDTRDPQDPSWRVDFGTLLVHMANGREVLDAILVGSKPPQNDSVWTSAKQKGFKVLTYDRSFSGEEKEVDTEIATQAAEVILLNRDEPGVVVLGSGDRDFMPTVRLAHRYNWTVEMCAFSSAFNPAGDMALAVEKIRTLDDVFDQIGRHDFDWPTK
ncbi:NYN domain-containing protein [Rhizobium leguminosarum]|uniref:NYN domain-containing protein n=1 Tax=Rhizobium leguminosarum TaxID=384 RepID=UPI001442983C|nr:NYN domain-containing protein [Rhizobium leguminosarum]NKL78692.1 NYN domain-containing protein [Rhizobium leguminosarum bv. viciae]